MEIANDETNSMAMINHVRIAGRGDTRLITKLLNHAPYSHIHADWHYPVDWLGSPGFVVMEKPVELLDDSLANRFFGMDSSLLACLAITAEPPPAAWVRVAAVAEDVDGAEALEHMFALVEKNLQQMAVSQIGWLFVDAWPQSWVHSLGFVPMNYVETFVKESEGIPNIDRVNNLKFRPVETEDLKILEQIEILAYEPLWRSSVVGLTLARRHAFSFDVVEYQGKIVGYQYSTLMHKTAHLSRITIDPNCQGKGIGSALLAHALEAYYRKGAESVTLNTQTDNQTSQRLYERFGFRPTDQRFPIWIKYIEPNP